MKNKKNIWLKTSTITCLVVAAAYFFHQEREPQPNSHSTADTGNNAPLASGNAVEKEIIMAKNETHSTTPPAATDTGKPISADLQERIDNIKQRRPDLNVSSAEIAAAVERKTSWEPAESTPLNLPLQPEELTDGRQFIQMDTLKMETLMPGDSLNVSVDESGQDYEVIIDKVEKHDYNSISWFGHIMGADGEKYSVSFTRGESLTVGGMDTPDGHFVLQAHGNNGWIASSQLLFKIDPNVSDVIYPADVDPDYTHSHPH